MKWNDLKMKPMSFLCTLISRGKRGIALIIVCLFLVKNSGINLDANAKNDSDVLTQYLGVINSTTKMSSHMIMRSKQEAWNAYDPSWRRTKENIRDHELIPRVLSSQHYTEFMDLIQSFLEVCEKINSWPVMRSGTMLGAYM